MEPRRDAMRAPVSEALASEVRRIDLVLARAYQILCVIGLAGSIVIYAVGHFAVAKYAAFGCLPMLAWVTLQRHMLGGKLAGAAMVIGTIVEASLPWAFLVIVAEAQGAEYALSSWVSPLLYCVVILAATARLRPMLPLVVGACGSLCFVVLYFAFLKPMLPPGAIEKPVLSPTMQVSRAVSFAVGAALATLVARSMRDVFGRAERLVRSQDLFGKYKLETRIAAGGMGTVHKATYCPEGGFQRTVAVKLVHPHLAQQEKFLDAFRAEAELSAALVHPNIVQVLDFGRAGDAYFLAMEYVDGVTLATLFKVMAARKRRLPPDVVAWIGQEISAALAFSHSEARDAEGRLLRIVHRDLCPSNILVSVSGAVKVLDFGVAKALRDAAVSETATIAGHLGYMAPEQVNAEPIDETCDLFGLGIILWELLALRPLFDRGAEGPTVLALIECDVPRLAGTIDGVDRDWDAFFTRAIAKRPGRFASAAEMRTSVSSLRAGAASRHETLAELVAWARLETLRQTANKGTLRIDRQELDRSEDATVSVPAK